MHFEAPQRACLAAGLGVHVLTPSVQDVHACCKDEHRTVRLIRTLTG